MTATTRTLDVLMLLDQHRAKDTPTFADHAENIVRNGRKIAMFFTIPETEVDVQDGDDGPFLDTFLAHWIAEYFAQEVKEIAYHKGAIASLWEDGPNYEYWDSPYGALFVVSPEGRVLYMTGNGELVQMFRSNPFTYMQTLQA